jgi:DNA invertase Pin-like site-specific DNA recombinase
VVSKLSRLGRSMLECMEMLSIASEKRINVYAIKGNWQLDRSTEANLHNWMKKHGIKKGIPIELLP